MAITKAEWEKIDEIVRQTTNARGWHRAIRWLKDWGLLSILFTMFAALIAIAVALANIAFSERDRNVDFRARVPQQLSALEGRIEKVEESMNLLLKRELKIIGQLPLKQFETTWM